MSNWVKDTKGMTIHDRSLEFPIKDQDTYITPTERFFVCNSGTTPRIDAQDYKLVICGEGVSENVTLSYGDLKSMPQIEVPAMLECAGNHRSLFRDVMGIELNKRPQLKELVWSFGAVGMAEWRGVRLGEVLEKAGIKDNAYHVCLKGSDVDALEGEVKIPIPVSKDMDADTIIALQMNGEALPPDHGFPARMIVPGWVGPTAYNGFGRSKSRTNICG
jgi:DMSO/TMAO reductase YedYZ molybdopterin-dependent catalytic subunit